MINLGMIYLRIQCFNKSQNRPIHMPKCVQNFGVESKKNYVKYNLASHGDEAVRGERPKKLFAADP